MKFEIIVKIISVLGAIFGTWKIISDITTGQKSRLREDYKFAKEFLEDIKNNPDLHPFTVEKGYQAIAGSTILSSEEVAYLLSLKNPGKCLNDYKLSKEYLKPINTKGDLHLAFAKKYSSLWSRKWRKIFYVSLYGICAIIAILPIFLPSKYLGLILITLPIYGYGALTSLNLYIRIERGEQLVKNQQRHTQRILLPIENTFSLKQK
jgi:hypothetical protein